MAMRFFLFRRVVFRSGLSQWRVLPAMTAQGPSSRIFVNVVLVQLNVAVTDHNGNYITGLRAGKLRGEPEDRFRRRLLV